MPVAFFGRPRSLVLSAAALVSLLRVGSLQAELRVRSDFPGGNLVVERIEGDTAHVAPDLRGGQPWFHWHFEAEVSRPGRAKFVFPKSMMIGIRGPAASVDGGRSWRWLGEDHATYAPREESFFYDFAEAGKPVRFSVSIPYLPADLQRFLDLQAGNPHLKRSVLAKTRNGTDVPLLQIGSSDPAASKSGARAMLLTARHHACDALASYVLEGFVHEALSDSPAAVEFRRRHLLFVVPMVDVDGVAAGDQGKNRFPHDHNRDYGDAPIYPEIRAIQELAVKHDIRLTLDMHCPALRGDIHEAFHFLGLGVPHVKENLDELIAWLREDRPQRANAPLNFLVDSKKPNAVNTRIGSHFFAVRPTSVFSATLEIPYAQSVFPLDADSARRYGRSLLKAWTRTQFLNRPSDDSAPAASRAADDHARFAAFRAEFLRLYRGKTAECEALAAPYLTPAAGDEPSARAIFRVEANALMALLRLHQKKYAESLAFSDAARSDRQASEAQRATAALLRLRAIAENPESSEAAVETALAESLELPDPAFEHRAKSLETVVDFQARAQKFEKAIALARRQLEVAATYEHGKILNRVASFHEQRGETQQAIAARRETVERLRPRLAPPPVSVFGAMMTIDLFDALAALPDTKPDELRAAATLVLEHKVTQEPVKQRVRATLDAGK